MPFVKIELTREGITREQKRQLIKGVTEVITDVLNKDPYLTHISIENVETDNWGHAGEQVSVLREQGISADKNENYEKANNHCNRCLFRNRKRDSKILFGKGG